MKKMFRFAGLCGAAIALLLALGMNLSAYAAEMPAQTEASVTLNSQPADVYAEMIDGKLYFSLRDYWVNIQRLSPERVKWFGDAQAVTDGNLFLFLKDQTCRSYFSTEAFPPDGACAPEGRARIGNVCLFIAGQPFPRYKQENPPRSGGKYIGFPYDILGRESTTTGLLYPNPVGCRNGLPRF